MNAEDYQLLLWIIGDQSAQFNLQIAVYAGLWVSLWSGYQILARIWRYIDYKLDVFFWTDTLDTRHNY